MLTVENPENCPMQTAVRPSYFQKLLPNKWDRPLIYQTDGQIYVLRSLGADGREGGTGDDLDMEHTGSVDER